MASLRSHHHCLETQIKRHKRSDERPCADSENPLSDFEVLLDSGNMASERWPGEDACDREEDACEHEEDACDPEKEDACEQMDRRTALDRLEDQLRRGARLTPRSRDLLEERVEADRRRLAEVQMAEAEVQTTTVMQLADAAAQADAGEQEEVQVADADVQTTVCQQADAAAQADAGDSGHGEVPPWMTIGEQAIDHVWIVLASVMLRRGGRYRNRRPEAFEVDQLARIVRDGALAIRHQAVMSREWADDPHHHRAVAVLRCGERGCDVETTSFECAVQHFGSRRHGKRPRPQRAQEVLNAIHRACRA